MINSINSHEYQLISYIKRLLSTSWNYIDIDHFINELIEFCYNNNQYDHILIFTDIILSLIKEEDDLIIDISHLHHLKYHISQLDDIYNVLLDYSLIDKVSFRQYVTYTTYPYLIAYCLHNPLDQSQNQFPNVQMIQQIYQQYQTQLQEEMSMISMEYKEKIMEDHSELLQFYQLKSLFSDDSVDSATVYLKQIITANLSSKDNLKKVTDSSADKLIYNHISTVIFYCIIYQLNEFYYTLPISLQNKKPSRLINKNFFLAGKKKKKNFIFFIYFIIKS